MQLPFSPRDKWEPFRDMRLVSTTADGKHDLTPEQLQQLDDRFCDRVRSDWCAVSSALRGQCSRSTLICSTRRSGMHFYKLDTFNEDVKQRSSQEKVEEASWRPPIHCS